MTPTLHTPRLILCPLELADAEQVQKIFPYWEIVRYLEKVVPWPYPPDGAYTFYRDIALPAIERGEAWHWTLRLKSAPDQVIGNITLRTGETKNAVCGWAFPGKDRGRMSEACDVVTTIGSKCSSFPCCASRRPWPTPARAAFQKSRACA